MTDAEHPVGEDDLQAAIDDRLPPERRAAVEAFLGAHPELRDRIATDARLREALRARLADTLAEPIPARLRIASLRAARRQRLWGRLRVAAAALVVFLAGGGSGLWLGRTTAPTTAPTAATQVVAADAGAAFRTYVVEVAHPVEVDATRETHLVQWLSKRLGRRLSAPDLTAHGWRLMGGRLLPGEKGAAAQFMYEDTGGGRLTLYVQASDGTETAFRFRRDGDTATFAWIDRGFGFAVTAATDRDRLLPIAEAVYRRYGEIEAPATSGG